MAAGFVDDVVKGADAISSIVDLYKYMDDGGNACCRALVGAWSYVHIQNISAQVWTVHHNLKTDDLVLFGYNAFMLGNDMRDWSQIIEIDNNTLQVIWPEPRTGRLVVVSSGSRPNPNLELFLQYLDAYPSFYTEYTYTADDYPLTKVHWDAATKTVKLFTITYTFDAGGYLIVKRIVHEINAQALTLTYAYNAVGDLLNVSRVQGMA